MPFGIQGTDDRSRLNNESFTKKGWFYRPSFFA
jgi:hypothetical protein